MRSGTSLVAQIVHRLGFPVSAFIPAPGPPSWRSDWEDVNLTMRLMLGLDVNWAGYVDERRKLSHAMGFEGRVAIKSPYLALHHKDLKEAFPDAQWVKCVRADADIERSMRAHPALSRAHQKRICAAMEKVGDLSSFEFFYADAMQAPFGSVSELAEYLDFDPYDARPDDILAAAALIGQPTEYSTCPPS